MLSKLVTSSLFAISQVEELSGQEILFKRPEIGSSAFNPEANVIYPGDTCCTFYKNNNFDPSNGEANVCLEEPYFSKEYDLS